MLQDMLDLFAYNRWANQRILDAAATLSAEELERDLGSSFPSVISTLRHILFAEWIWLERWNGRSRTDVPRRWKVADLEDLRRHWAKVDEKQDAFLQGLRRGDLERPVHYRDTRGRPFAGTLPRLMRHVVNHSSYHRGQVVTLLRQLGARPPTTDLVLFDREQAEDRGSGVPGQGSPR